MIGRTEAPPIVSTATIIAVGVRNDGRREVLGIGTGPTEAETFWKSFMRFLADRGLRGVKLVIADDHEGLRAAASKVFQATQQRCRIHLSPPPGNCITSNDFSAGSNAISVVEKGQRASRAGLQLRSLRRGSHGSARPA